MKTMQQGSTKTNGFKTAGRRLSTRYSAAGRFFDSLPAVENLQRFPQNQPGESVVFSE